MDNFIRMDDPQSLEDYLDRLESGDPLRDWYTEIEIQIALGKAIERMDSLYTAISDAYDLMDKGGAWGALNQGQMQCSCCETAYAKVDEAMQMMKCVLLDQGVSEEK